jgi:cell shape-determining protein MreC
MTYDNSPTTIQVSRSTKADLDELKLVPREDYNSVIERLIERCANLEEENETLIEELEELKKERTDNK